MLTNDKNNIQKPIKLNSLGLFDSFVKYAWGNSKLKNLVVLPKKDIKKSYVPNEAGPNALGTIPSVTMLNVNCTVLVSNFDKYLLDNDTSSKLFIYD